MSVWSPTLPRALTIIHSPSQALPPANQAVRTSLLETRSVCCNEKQKNMLLRLRHLQPPVSGVLSTPLPLLDWRRRTRKLK
eukprot:6378380-Pyramimonas_sp.AAC.1